MKKKKIIITPRRGFLLNGAVLALSGIMIRTAAVSFNGYISRRIGAEAMGLFSLVMSVYGLAVTLASSGVNLAAVRLTAEAVASGADRRGLHIIMRRTALYGLLFGLLSATLVLLSASAVGTHLLGDERAVISLRAMALGMPAISVTSAIAGYFTGTGRAYRNAIVSAVEQAVKTVLILGGIVVLLPMGTEYACLALVGGSALAESISLAVSYLLLICDRRRTDGGRSKPVQAVGFGKIASIALPVAIGSYIRQGFTTAEHIAIPWGLRAGGSDPSRALESYGVLHGMALPLVLYSSAIIGAFAGLLIPELAGLAEAGERREIRRLSLSSIRLAICFSVGVAGALSFFGYELGIGVYGSGEAGGYIRLLAPLVPLMFLDTTVDCILKGLGEQVYTMKVNIADAAICLVLVLLLVPRAGVIGYVFVIYVSEAVNAALSIMRMQSKTGLRISPKMLLLPFLSAAASYASVNATVLLLVHRFGLLLPVYVRLFLYASVYIGITSATGGLSDKREAPIGKSLERGGEKIISKLPRLY